MNEYEEEELKVLRNMFYSTFFSTEDSTEVLIHILGLLGYFETNPLKIIPENIAVANKILSISGAKTLSNLASYKNALNNSSLDTINEEDNEEDKEK